MGCFANGTEAMLFEGENCVRCLHSDLGEGKEIGAADNPCCPVFNAHTLYGYSEYHNNENIHAILDMLIERTADGGNVCRMFAEKPSS